MYVLDECMYVLDECVYTYIPAMYVLESIRVYECMYECMYVFDSNTYISNGSSLLNVFPLSDQYSHELLFEDLKDKSPSRLLWARP
jgi:hypothetical protein